MHDVDPETSRADAAPRASSLVRLLVAGEVILSLVLGFVDIGSKTFWQDEAFSAMLSGGTWRQAGHVVIHNDPNMSAYDVLIRFWKYIGTSESALRSLSALAVAAAVPFMFLLARRLYDERTGLVAGLLFATAPFVVHYQQEARGYGVLLLCIVASSWCFARSLDDDGERFWLPAAVLGVLAVYLHYFGAFVVVAQVLSLFLLDRGSVPRRRVVKEFGTLAVLVMPAVLLAVFGPHAQVSWIKFSRNIATTETRTLAGGHVLLVIMAAAAVVAVVLDVSTLRRHGKSARGWALGFPILWAALPIVASLAYSVLVKPFYVSRYLIVALPGMILVAAMAIALIRAVWLLTAVLLVTMGASAVQIKNWYQRNAIEDWPAAVAAVAAGASPDDGIVFCNVGLRPAFEYYLRNVPDSKRPTPISPAARWADGVHEDEATPDDVRSAKRPRIWVVTSPGFTDEPTCRAALEGMTRIDETLVQGVDVQLWRATGTH